MTRFHRPSSSEVCATRAQSASMSLPDRMLGSISAAAADTSSSGAISSEKAICQPLVCTTSGTSAGNSAKPRLSGAEPQTAKAVVRMEVG